MKNVIIFGASGHGSVIMDCIEKEGKYKLIGFLDSIKQKGLRHNGYEILGTEFDLPYIIDKYNIFGGIVAIGDNWVRKQVVDKIKKIAPKFSFIRVIHPQTIIGKNVVIGKGSAIMPGVIINTNSTVGNHCILNTFSSLDHDGYMHDYSSLAPKVTTGGNFSLGRYSAVCLGGQIIENINVGQHSVIGAGSLVLRSVPNNTLCYGVPAKIIKNRKIGDPYLVSSNNRLDSESHNNTLNRLFKIS
ncbi:acetyltransferase [Muriicola sp. E247]|uniref:acetyltransferase n=1 Tax=Muriicola sp. E247 TaxID=3242730 RepID=UPI003524614A